MKKKQEPKDGEYWVVRLSGGDREVVLVTGHRIYPCGDEEGYLLVNLRQVEWIRRIRL
jgi:hypothetical protein